ncbi:bacterial regulatory helix-turn-helix, lysR family protein [Lysobacter antibioticus]|uniref:LysR family transcriptional regulator n=1 Tax=Lysobacter antibioticus TaxID=84531 RepID=UPI000716FE50|nr:LysR family transcriptional regulator [Lysobacter antibioticus]ALN61079.1 bacterial regulatory helix-turn-helix, lysR family protein [Lysobacter antibioticus]
MARKLPSLNALYAFEAAARLQSVTQAASELHVTHGAVSRQIKALEGELGKPLFARQGRGLGLTPAGLQLRDATGAAFQQLEDAWSDLRRRRLPSALVLGCQGSILARWVIPRLPRLGLELPDLNLHLVVHEGDFDARMAGLDAALLVGEPPSDDGWLVHTLTTERIGPVVSPRYAGFDALLGRSASSLLDQALLQTSSRPQAWPAWARANGMDSQALTFGASFEHLYYLLEAAVAGLGVAIAPQPLVSEDIAAGRLAAPWGFVETPGCWMLCCRRNDADSRVTRLADWLRRELDATPV